MTQSFFETLGIRPFYVDKILLGVSAALLLTGYLIVASASLHLGVKTAADVFHYPLRQVIHIVLGLIGGGLICMIPMSLWQRYSGALFGIGLFLLAVIFIPGIGVKVNGSIRWISLAGVRIQVSEVVKLVSVLYMAGSVLRHQQQLQQSDYGALKALIPFIPVGILLLMEPDLGSAVVIAVLAMGILFLAGARLKQFLWLIVAGLALVAALIRMAPYRWARITAFLDPWADARDTGFQLVQALIAFGQGGLVGVGLGNGIQKLFYLPEAHTDFLFSVLAEECGLLGELVVIALFSLLVWRIFAIGRRAEQAGQLFNAYVAYGMGIWFGFQAFVNMGVNMGLLPTKGITLPLMSYGGGSMLVMCAAIAMVLRVSHEVQEKQVSTRPEGVSRWKSA